MNYKKMSVKQLVDEAFDAGGKYYTSTYCDFGFKEDQELICDAITRELNRRLRAKKK